MKQEQTTIIIPDTENIIGIGIFLIFIVGILIWRHKRMKTAIETLLEESEK